MAQQIPEFDPNLRSALKRTPLAAGAPPELKARMVDLVRAGGPSAAASSGKRSGSLNDPKVFGLPRVYGLAAAIAMLVLGGGLIAYQLRDFFPNRNTVAYVDPMKAMIDGLKQVHGSTPDPTKATTDLSEFQRKLPGAMPVATLAAANATLVSATLEQLNGRYCYALRYLVDGKTFTVVTADVRLNYQIPKYNEIEGSLRLFGGEKQGFLVCVIGDKGVPEAQYQTLFNEVAMLPSPSTQPMTSLTGLDNCSIR